ncbi:MAG TPA: metallophosphoesterase [Myxococcales bacterium]|jgi:predicted phosphohydrolase
MPRLAWATDLHLNFLSEEALAAFGDTLARSEADLLLVSGDTSEAYTLEHHLALLARRFDGPVWFVLGNHDFYRGSIAQVRRKADALKTLRPGLRWLQSAGVVSLSPQTALVGCDGFGDARLGNVDGSAVVLNDFLLIDELTAIPHAQRLARLGKLGDEAAEHLRSVLWPALEEHRRAVVLTHVPPFPEACWHDGQMSDPEWLPYFCCMAAGQALREAALAFPKREILVLCGHTHSGGEVEILPNLKVLTAGAEYGKPRIDRVISLD